MFDRLVGLETEYVIRFHPSVPGGRRVSNSVLFEALLRHVRSKVPTAAAIVKEYGWFTANGGALRFERIPVLDLFLPSAGLVEGATPECRGPRQLLVYQRAQDVLLSRAAATSAGTAGEVTLLKNNRDSRGACCGSHENYEMTVASGPALLLWRLGLAVLLPAVAVPACIAVVLALALAVLLYAPVIALGRWLRRDRSALSAWESGLGWLFRLALWPVLLVPELFVRLTAFRRQRRGLLAFLISRPILAGTGMLDLDGRFSLSPRAGAVRSLCSTGAEMSRPVFFFGHVLKGTLGVLLGDIWSYKRLFHRRQRLQLGVGDSNMAQTAEYLKIGTTLLVLDAIEAGELADPPRVRRPLRALRTICADPDLEVAVRLNRGRRWTALQIQRFYLEACRRFVNRAGPGDAEAQTVLRLWGETLDALEQDPRRLVGKVDWITKRHLIDSAARDASAEARRKIDIRYHELARDGYYLRLEAAGIAPTLVEPEDVLNAIEIPPEGTPAAIRGGLIREFALAPHQLHCGWCSVVINSGPRPRVVHL